jgi:hypothetical protein
MPRARAAFQLYAVATAFADYALCMVGPTGPSLLRDNPPEFWRLARRRLVAALPDDRPFMKCEKSASVVSDSTASRRAHQAAASAYLEWGGDDGPPFKLADLGITTRRLADLTERAWPFVRGGYTSLVQPSSYAPEAAHPTPPPSPFVGRGAVPLRSLSRCVVPDGDAEFVLDLSPDHRSKMVRSVSRQGTSSAVSFAPAEARVFSVSCDGSKVVIGTGHEGSRDVELVACSFGGSCEPVPLPRVSAGSFTKFPLDVARVDGVTVVAVTMRGIVRVASSRDDGVSWTPLIVTFDPDERSGWKGGADGAARLVTNGHRLLVAGGSTTRSSSYWALASDDAGASWHSP